MRVHTAYSTWAHRLVISFIQTHVTLGNHEEWAGACVTPTGPSESGALLLGLYRPDPWQSPAFTPGGRQGAQNAGVRTPPTPRYVAVLRELAAVQQALGHLRDLETHLLALLHDVGVTDDEIGTVQNISSQAVGQKRKRKTTNNG